MVDGIDTGTSEAPRAFNCSKVCRNGARSDVSSSFGKYSYRRTEDETAKIGLIITCGMPMRSPRKSWEPVGMTLAHNVAALRRHSGGMLVGSRLSGWETTSVQVMCV